MNIIMIEILIPKYIYEGRILRVSNLIRSDSTLILLPNVNINEMGKNSEFFFLSAVEHHKIISMFNFAGY